MGNISERETNAEPRMGIAPFADRLTIDMSDNGTIYKRSKSIQLGSLGNASLALEKPTQEYIEKKVRRDEQAVTIDLSGQIHTGNLQDFLKAGYHMLALVIENAVYSRQAKEHLMINVWVDRTESNFSAHIVNHGAMSISIFMRRVKGVKHTFVLPEDPKILQAVRINVNNQQYRSVIAVTIPYR